MKIYTALLKADAAPVLVREGFSWGGLVLGPLWLAAHRAWIAAAISLAACVLVVVFAAEPAGGILVAGVALILGLTGNETVRATTLAGSPSSLFFGTEAPPTPAAWC